MLQGERLGLLSVFLTSQQSPVTTNGKGSYRLFGTSRKPPTWEYY